MLFGASFGSLYTKDGNEWKQQEGFAPVSYTHLDVYKRQDLGRVVWDTQRSLRHSAFTLLLNMYIKQCEKDHVAPDFISHDFPDLLGQIDQYFMDTTPLAAPRMVNGELELPLLSQQDVYKRQAQQRAQPNFCSPWRNGRRLALPCMDAPAPYQQP